MWRRATPLTDNDIQKGGTSFSLLSNINSLKFRYIGGSDKKPDWKTEWKSSLDTNKPTQLPHAVEITLEVKSKKQVLKFHKVALIHHPDIFIPEIKIPKTPSIKKP